MEKHQEKYRYEKNLNCAWRPWLVLQEKDGKWIYKTRMKTEKNVLKKYPTAELVK